MMQDYHCSVLQYGRLFQCYMPHFRWWIIGITYNGPCYAYVYLNGEHCTYVSLDIKISVHVACWKYPPLLWILVSAFCSCSARHDCEFPPWCCRRLFVFTFFFMLIGLLWYTLWWRRTHKGIRVYYIWGSGWLQLFLENNPVFEILLQHIHCCPELAARSSIFIGSDGRCREVPVRSKLHISRFIMLQRYTLLV
jgi:hypothetical protein